MKELYREIFFIVYLVVTVLLAAGYFSVPERVQFMEFQIEWWKELFTVILSFFH